MNKNKIVLAINYDGHDTSAAISIGDKIIAACEQERYDGLKHSRKFPVDAINDCLKIAKTSIKKLDQVVICVDPKNLINKFFLEPATKDFKKNEIYSGSTKKFYNLLSECLTKKKDFFIANNEIIKLQTILDKI